MRDRFLFVARMLLAIALLQTVSCASKPAPVALERFSFQRPQMGLPFQIILYAPDETSAKVAADAAFARIRQLNDIMSDYDPDSELSRLSRTSGRGQPVKVSDDLWKVLSYAQEISEKSRGAFDVTVGPVVQLWRKARREKKFPEKSQLDYARASVGFEKIRLHEKERTVELLVKDMKLDLGGIAKGYAVDEAQKILRAQGIRSALVAGGGDMLASEPPPGKKAWRVELSSIDETNAPKEFLLLKNMALATSGDMFQFVEIEGKRYSHIVDPRTGVGLTDHGLVNVVARDCMTADALSKLASVLPVEEAICILKETRGVEVRILRKPGAVVEKYESKGFQKFLERKSS